MEGPYYSSTLVHTVDLTNGATSEIVVLEGVLLNTDCNPIRNAKIDIWHANQAGEYDLSEGERVHYGFIITDENGEFSIRTILPGAYLNGPNVYRPRHYHIKIWVEDIDVLTTQLYFEGDEYLIYEPNIPTELMLSLAESPDGWTTSYTFVV